MNKDIEKLAELAMGIVNKCIDSGLTDTQIIGVLEEIKFILMYKKREALESEVVGGLGV